MHYVDEGRGKPIVMVHGTPTWSFIYRHLIKGLSDDFRVIAPDNIGFGLSEKPENWSYRPSDHAKNLAYLIESLGLEDITLVVHDFGGPIGLAYAVENPQNVSRIIIFNTFMWSLRGDPSFERPYRLMNNFLGKTLYKRFNFSANVMIRAAWGDKRKLTREIHRHYIHALAEAKDRQGTWIFLQELIKSSDWYDYLWNRARQDPGQTSFNSLGDEGYRFQRERISSLGEFLHHETGYSLP